MRIDLLSNHGAMGGGEVMLLHLAAAARSLGHTVTVVGPIDSELEHRARAEDLDVIGVTSGSKAVLVAAYAAHCVRSRADLLWCNGPVPALGATFTRRPFVVHLHQEPAAQQRRLLSLARRRAVATFVPSRSMAERMPGTIALANWTDDPRMSAPTRRPFPSIGDPVRVGFIGRLSSDKGVDVLADAIGRLSTAVDASNAPNVELVIAGEPRFVSSPDAQRVERSLDRIADRVTRLGWTTVDAFHRQVDIVVVPSVWAEPFGLVAAESLSRRTPVVVTDAGALPEIVGRDHPWIVPAGRADAIATCIAAMLGRPDEVARSVDAGYDRWRADYSPEAGRSRLDEALRTLGIPH